MSIVLLGKILGFAFVVVTAFWVVSFYHQKNAGMSETESFRNSSLWAGLLIAFSAIDFISLSHTI